VAADFVHETLLQAHAEGQMAAARARNGTADQLSKAQAGPGMSPDTIARHQAEIAVAREHAGTTATSVHDLEELGEPGLTPGPSRPGVNLAAKDWHTCGHGNQPRHPGREPETEPEAC
jgi:hypothetical protein